MEEGRLRKFCCCIRYRDGALFLSVYGVLKYLIIFIALLIFYIYIDIHYPRFKENYPRKIMNDKNYYADSFEKTCE